MEYDLSRIDLWDEKIGKLDNLEELIYLQLNEFNLKVSQAYELYELIADQDINPINEIRKM